MGRSASEVERFLAASAGTLRRLAWLLTGEAGSATELLRATLVAAYVGGRGGTDAERAVEARRWMVGEYLRGAEDVRTTRRGVPVRLRPREWAAAVLVHGLGVAERAAAEATHLHRGEVEEVLERTRSYARLLRGEEPPPSVGWFDAAEVRAAAGPALARRRAGRRRVLAAVLAGLLAVAAGGVLLPQLNHVEGQAIRIEPDARFGWPLVETWDGQSRGIQVLATRDHVTVTLHGLPEGPLTAPVPAPTEQDQIAQGEIAGMPFYVVQGDVAEAWVTFGPTVSDVSDRSVRVFEAGEWRVLWPSQRMLAYTSREPVGVLWRNLDGMRRAAPVSGRYPQTDRMAFRIAGTDERALLMADGTSLMLLTWDGQRTTPIVAGRALLGSGPYDVPLGHTAVGYGRVTRAAAPGEVNVVVERDPGASPMYVLHVRGSESPPPPTVPVTVYDGERVVGRVTLKGVPAPGPS